MEIRPYIHDQDFDRVSQFLIDIYQPGDLLANWLQSRWEYMHYHTFILDLDRTKIGIAEARGEVVGVVHFEGAQHEVFFQVHPEFESIRFDLLTYAEEINVRGISKSTGRMIRAVYVNDFDLELSQYVEQQGYEKWSDFTQFDSSMSLKNCLPDISLPEGFYFQSLADENDLHKINRVLWRGFDHPGPPPEDEIPGREFGQQAPNFRKDLVTVVVAPDGNYVSYCGMWHLMQNKVAHVEPVATDPDFRRMGLGRAAVLESVRKAAEEGAETAWVGSGQPFYLAIGFEKKSSATPWVKFLDE